MYAKPKKSLGQNFLTDKNIQNKIIKACDLKASDIVLEIGAGRGELTSLIAQKVGRVYAVEIDVNLCSHLKTKFKNFKNTTIINKNILDLNIRDYFKATSPRIKVIGNIPYYISSPILEHLINSRAKLSQIFLSVQKEFAKRLVACPGSKDYSPLSCFIQYYLEPKIIFQVKKGSFLPPPKVDSSFLRLTVRKEPPVEVKDEELFFNIVRKAFNKRRKTLRNSLKETIPSQKLEQFFRAYSINRDIRPEDLALQNFADLANL